MSSNNSAAKQWTTSPLHARKGEGSSRVLEPRELAERLDRKDMVIVDLSMPSAYAEGHVPGAVHLAYPTIVHAHDDAACDIPPEAMLAEALGKIGVTPDHHVVAYDGQSCPMACRLLWTLEEIGHRRYSLLNGGWHSWLQSGLPVETQANSLDPVSYAVSRTGRALATKADMLTAIGDPGKVILDTRLEEEFTNELVTTDRGGRIPGAVHFNWMDGLDEANGHRLRPIQEVLPLLYDCGVTPDKEILVYCQTHFRSAHTWWLLKSLGFPRVKGYAAGYSEWGNDPETPIEDPVEETED